MNLVSRYIIRQMAVMAVYALLAFLALYSFFEIIDEAGNLGRGNYGGWEMAQYVLLQMPARAYELMPLGVLIGGLIALSQLASGSELTVMKASGLSTKRLLLILSQFGLIFAVATAVLGEWVAPSLSQRAENIKASAVHGKISAGASGLWLKEQNNIINVREMLPDHTLLGIKIWRHDDCHELVEAAEAERAVLNADGSWLLKNVRRSVLGADKIDISETVEESWPVSLKSSLLDVLLVDPEQMSVAELTTYITHLENNHQQTQTYEIAWWRKLVYPVAAWVMALVAFAFTPQNTRHGNMGLKLFGGICLGLAFHFAGRLFGFTSQLYGIPPFLAGALPTIIFALLAVYLIRRQEKR
ncbi:LPS export ABC transporter permease LptG [Neisseria animalis]|uniref:LPS export ABC transporter permease LptG n=1 Tax=Neisseria animalis TaxID=492 RepID=A0A5P3MPI2_NEIAN|nr:LPS export ABC transporter permease LptG [Neisseria animalis]QEY23436.1 LPS export ABC transporter permease LptG [Neisseria animalis]ROW33282.1 LPS export ABC transporter permease LptG [Neisseria animalis]VEE08931.1 putative permease [Neisseria animalis]